MKLSWIEEHWSPVEASNAKEWIIDAATAFCTARRHKNNKQPSSTTVSASSLTDRSATSNQVRGMARLASLSSLPRQVIALPVLPTLHTSTALSVPRGPSLSASNTPRGSPIPSRATTPCTPVPLSQPLPEPTSAEIAAKEEAELREDRITATHEFMRYVGAGLESPIMLNL
ncbi:hypothetical protein M378DRAFT_17698, partial [Amanita muscaria Koide BX008]